MKNVLKLVALSIIASALCLSTYAQKSKQESSLLWKISKKENKDISYLFGTIHIICAEDYFWTPSMQKAFDQSKQVCMEMNLNDPNLIADASLMMLDLSGGTLRDYFSNESDYKLVARYIEDSLGQNIEIAERMKPVALYMIYSMGMIKGPCKESVSYELKLAEKSKTKNTPLVGLETLAEQMEALETIPTDTIIQQMIRLAKGELKDKNTAQDLIKAYKKQDLLAINKLVIQSTEEGGMDGKVFIDNRNKKWIAPMKTMMHEKSTFFAVGAGHVSGLLQLLKAEGYTVEPIK